jgi:hypothetical protein
MLLLGEPLEPCDELARKLDIISPLPRPRNHKSLGDKLTRVLRQAKVRAHAIRNGDYGPLRLTAAPTKDILSENYTDEEIRQQALALVRQTIISSRFTPAEYRKWVAANRVIAAMSKKHISGSEEVDAFIKNRTKSTIL